eukprot:gb/GECG01012868.1/.p1 GENE.gb/GECG01012868.1/~~gb/GECG01012868.1/.p1  ORF type:complete len:159 (+),score=29.72 gb/GECG01012868.1/:1-477(+)
MSANTNGSGTGDGGRRYNGNQPQTGGQTPSTGQDGGRSTRTGEEMGPYVTEEDYAAADAEAGHQDGAGGAGGTGGEGSRRGYTEEGDETWDAEDERLLRNIGDHPLMERVQATLQKQLEQRYDRVVAELKEKKRRCNARGEGTRRSGCGVIRNPTAFG